MKKNEMRKVVLVLHGFPGLSQNDPIRRYLSVQDFDAVIPDLFSVEYNFTLDSINNHVEKLLEGKKPDIIIAASLGGLLAPYFALKYSEAKLVMIATGSKLNIGIPIYNLLLRKGNESVMELLIGVAQKVPVRVYNTFYRVFNPYKPMSGEREQYLQNINETFINFRKFPKVKTAELLSFVRNINNIKLLQSLKNRTIIFTGGNDLLMPKDLSYELKSLIENSTLIENKERLHYHVFDERDFDRLDRFLNVKN